MKEPGRCGWFEPFNRFHLYHYFLFNEQVETVSTVEGPAAINERQWLLSFDVHPALQKSER